MNHNFKRSPSHRRISDNTAAANTRLLSEILIVLKENKKISFNDIKNYCGINNIRKLKDALNFLKNHKLISYNKTNNGFYYSPYNENTLEFKKLDLLDKLNSSQHKIYFVTEHSTNGIIDEILFRKIRDNYIPEFEFNKNKKKRKNEKKKKSRK